MNQQQEHQLKHLLASADDRRTKQSMAREVISSLTGQLTASEQHEFQNLLSSLSTAAEVTISVSKVDSTTLSFSLLTTDTVQLLKKTIEEMEGTPAVMQRLVHATSETPLRNDSVLSSLKTNKEEDDPIELILLVDNFGIPAYLNCHPVIGSVDTLCTPPPRNGDHTLAIIATFPANYRPRQRDRVARKLGAARVAEVRIIGYSVAQKKEDTMTIR
jgi:hypothetical protein